MIDGDPALILQNFWGGALAYYILFIDKILSPAMAGSKFYTNMARKLKGQTAVVVDVVIFTIEDNTLKVLLRTVMHSPFKGYLALPGGFVWGNETTEQAAWRVLEEKTGLKRSKDIYIEQLYSFDNLGRDPRGHVVSVSYFALIDTKKIKIKNFLEIGEPMFYKTKKLSKLAFDHKQIINYAIERLRYKLEYTNVVFSLLPKYFTFTELQSAYETILDKKMDKRNFRKKFFGLGLIKMTKHILSDIQHRPARLYAFVSHKPIRLKRFF